MVTERIDIEITDKISAGVVRKIQDIADNSKKAFKALELLKKELLAIDGSAIKKLNAESVKLSSTLMKEALAKNKVNQANIKTAISEKRLAAATIKTAIESKRLAAAQSRTAAAASRAAAAKDRAAIASLRLAKANKRARGAVRGLNTDLGLMLRTAIAFAGAGLGGGAILGLGEKYTVLQNKLKNVTESSKQLESVTKRVFQIANDTRSPVEETAQAFQRFDLALVQLGASQEESLRLTETVNKQLIVSGAATSEQASALLQLSQAFNKGKLDGDEFRSVMELMPPVADAIAKQLKVTRGELLDLAPAGKITAEVMRKALANAADEVDKKFAKTIPTIAQSFTVLKNKAVQFFGELDKKYGITKKISEIILKLSENMDLLAVAVATVSALLLVAFGPQLIASTTKFFALLASNPTGLIIIGLTTIVGLLAVFQDEIKVTDDGVVTLGDTFKATLKVIGDYIAPVVEFFKAAWASAFDNVSKNTTGFTAFFGKAIEWTAKIVKAYLNTIIGLYVGTYKTIVALWSNFGNIFKDIFFQASKFALSAIEFMINKSVEGINKLIGVVNNLNKKLGLDSRLNKIDFKLDLSDFKSQGKSAIGEFGKTLKDNFKDSLETDYIGTFISKVKAESRKFAAERLKRNQPQDEELRGKTRAKKVAKKGKESTKETYEEALAKVNRNLDSQIKLTKLLGVEREKVQMFDRINNALLAKKFVLTEADKKQIVNKINLLVKEKEIYSELSKIYEETKGAQLNLETRLEANNRAFEQGLINLDDYKNRLTGLRLEMAQLNLEMDEGMFGDIMTDSLSQMTDGFLNSASAISDAFGDLFTTLSDGFADSIGRAIVYGDDLGESLKDVARNAISQLISAFIKMGIQWVATQALQKAALTTTTAASVASAGATNAAWTPAAITASIATFGGAAATGGAAVTASFASSLAAIKAASAASTATSAAGFESGGYTGNGRTDDIAGVVHGREFVMNAQATSRIGVNNLQALQSGNTNIQNVNSSAQAAPNNVKIVNVLDPALVSDFLGSAEGDTVFVNMLERNSEYVKSLSND